MQSPVLILTNASDPHADAVIHFLNELDVPVVRFHPGEIVDDALVVLSPDRGCALIPSSGREFDVTNLRSVWYRRPESVGEQVTITDKESRSVTIKECDAFARGLYYFIDSVWYSYPPNIREAGIKPRSLRVAKQCGFAIPPYILSNDRSALRDFVDNNKDVVLKPINEQITAITLSNELVVLQVHRVTLDDLAPILARPLLGPIYLQKYVRRGFDVRVTVIGREVFAVSILQPGDGTEIVDWRQHVDLLRHEPVECPEQIKAAMFRYLRHMGLNFGAFDFIVDNNGQWWFLECNPNGQWLWMEFAAGLPLSETMARSLALELPPLVDSGSGDRMQAHHGRDSEAASGLLHLA